MSSTTPIPHQDIRANKQNDRNVSDTPSTGAAANRSRRLQLRNAGFRGPAMATRKITPTSNSQQMATVWASIASPHDHSDRENRSPSPSDNKWSQQSSKRTSSGGRILQEISNSSLRRRGKLTPKPSATSMFVSGVPDDMPKAYDGTFPEYLSSPAPPTPSSIKIRTTKTRKKVAPRRSISGETRKYVDHLESELAAAQSQLSSVTSPSLSRAQTSKVRQLSADNKRLNKQIEEWEKEYEQRIHEEVEWHKDIEAELRADIRGLQDKLEDALFRAQELETSLEAANTNFHAVEDANFQLEKRLEILSEILATSPNKIDLHVHSRSPRRRQSRPWSMLPRFPTGGPVGVSPDRCSWTRPTSPTATFHKHFGSPDELRHQEFASSSDAMTQPSHAINTESVFPGPDIADTASSVATGLPHDLEHNLPVFPMNTMAALQSPKPKQARRMRRFHGGSTGPRPLILPSTTHFEPYLASAPPYDRHEPPPHFNIPDTSSQLCTPQPGRRRASTQADQHTLARLASSPLLTAGDLFDENYVSADPVQSSPPPSDRAPMYFSSLGSVAGRNLMDELSELQLMESEPSYRPESSGVGQVEARASMHEDLTVLVQSPSTKRGSDEDDQQGDSCLNSSPLFLHSHYSFSPRNFQGDETREATDTSPILSEPVIPSKTPLYYRMKRLCADLWHSPVELARHLIQSASRTLPILNCLRDIQWWIVGLLLGPMARHKTIAGTLHRDDHSVSLSSDTASPQTHHVTSSSVCSSASTCRKRIAGHGRKRANVGQGHEMQAQEQGSRHSPWLWLKFSVTLAVAVGTAFTRGPGTLLLDREAVVAMEGENRTPPHSHRRRHPRCEL